MDSAKTPFVYIDDRGVVWAINFANITHIVLAKDGTSAKIFTVAGETITLAGESVQTLNGMLGRDGQSQNTQKRK